MADMTEAEKKATEEAAAAEKAAKEQAEKEKAAADAAKKKKQKVKLIKQVKLNGEIHRAGEKIEVTKEEAAELRAVKALFEEDDD